MSIHNVLAGVAVLDLDRSLSWYGELLGREPDTRPMPGVAEWSFAGGGWVQLFEDHRRAGASSLTLVESDLAGRLNKLVEKQIRIEEQSESDFVKTAQIRDPDGNRIVIAEAVSAANKAAAMDENGKAVAV